MHTQSNSASNKVCAIITGATGMVGEGVLHECLASSDVERVLVIGRKPCGVTHPKLTEIVHGDFWDLTPIEDRLRPYNACFFCLGVSSVGLKEAEYTRLTYDLTLHAAGLLSKLNPDMVFCYVTGVGTDSTEQGKSMWARVKGRTENAIMRLPFRGAYMFRPGYIHPTKGLRNAHKYYSAFSWLYPAVKRLWPKHFITLRELGMAMIHAAKRGHDRQILEPKDIIELAKR